MILLATGNVFAAQESKQNDALVTKQTEIAQTKTKFDPFLVRHNKKILWGATLCTAVCIIQQALFMLMTSHDHGEPHAINPIPLFTQISSINYICTYFFYILSLQSIHQKMELMNKEKSVLPTE